MSEVLQHKAKYSHRCQRLFAPVQLHWPFLLRTCSKMLANRRANTQLPAHLQKIHQPREHGKLHFRVAVPKQTEYNQNRLCVANDRVLCDDTRKNMHHERLAMNTSSNRSALSEVVSVFCSDGPVEEVLVAVVEILV